MGKHLYATSILAVPSSDTDPNEPQGIIMKNFIYATSLDEQAMEQVVNEVIGTSLSGKIWTIYTKTISLEKEQVEKFPLLDLYIVAFLAIREQEGKEPEFFSYALYASSSEEAEQTAALHTVKNIPPFEYYAAQADKVPDEIRNEIVQNMVH